MKHCLLSLLKLLEALIPALNYLPLADLEAKRSISVERGVEFLPCGKLTSVVDFSLCTGRAIWASSFVKFDHLKFLVFHFWCLLLQILWLSFLFKVPALQDVYNSLFVEVVIDQIFLVDLVNGVVLWLGSQELLELLHLQLQVCYLDTCQVHAILLKE